MTVAGGVRCMNIDNIDMNLLTSCLGCPPGLIIIIIMFIFKCYFSGEHIALSINKNNNGVNIALGKTNRLKALCMMQINT